MHKTIRLILAALLGTVASLGQVGAAPQPAAETVPAAAPAANAAKPVNVRPPTNSTADHSKFEALRGPFKTGPEVTKACLSCHTEAGKQVQHTKHWTWDITNPKTGQKLGKKNLINNFCTSTVSNEKDCMACHAGYGWEDASFDFSNEQNVDCLVCHDTTATYRKLPGDAGHPIYERKEFPHGSGKFVEAVDLAKVAQNIGKTSRNTCGACHFFGAGANGTKHGDLDTSLNNPGKHLDVHMARNGLNFTCATCHTASSHQVAGSRYQMDAAPTGDAHLRGQKDDSPASCQSCHGNRPHPERLGKLNDHTRKLACQTCHIPEFARNDIGTELSWDWSKATTMGADGQPFNAKDSAGRRAFDSKKGAWAWDSFVVPEYRWFNGEFTYTTYRDKIDPNKVVQINRPGGTVGGADSRIWPFKVHRGKQPYDTEYLNLTVQHTAGEDDTALWHNYDWQKAISKGMQTVGLPYSGKYDFVNTEMYWPITHMVAPKGDALHCQNCHVKEGGRLQGIEGIYLPGRDANPVIDSIGWSIVGLTFLGSLVHGLVRIATYRRNRRKEQ